MSGYGLVYELKRRAGGLRGGVNGFVVAWYLENPVIINGAPCFAVAID
jgi:hypothetical protein